MTYFEMAKELQELVIEGDIENKKHCKFIDELATYLSETDEYADEEITEEQVKYLHWLYDGYCNDDWQPYEDYV